MDIPGSDREGCRIESIAKEERIRIRTIMTAYHFFLVDRGFTGNVSGSGMLEVIQTISKFI